MLIPKYKCLNPECKREVWHEGGTVSDPRCSSCSSPMFMPSSHLRCDECKKETDEMSTTNALTEREGWYRFSCSSHYHDKFNYTSGFTLPYGQLDYCSILCFEAGYDRLKPEIIQGAKKSYPSAEVKGKI